MNTCIDKLKDFENKLKIAKKGITITVSGLTGSGKSTVAEAIAKELSLKYKSLGDIFRELAKEKDIDIYEFSKKRSKEKDIMLDKKALELAIKGNIVLNGRIAGWVAGDHADIKIWVKCDLDVRAERVAKRENKTVKEAKKDLKKRDKSNNKRYKELYKIDPTDKSIYDFVFDNTKASLKEAKKVPLEYVKERLKL